MTNSYASIDILAHLVRYWEILSTPTSVHEATIQGVVLQTQSKSSLNPEQWK